MEEEPICKVTELGDKVWLLNGKLHRTDGPAVEKPNGQKEWFINGRRHRADGPAIEHPNGGVEWHFKWWLYGIKIPSEEEYIKRRQLQLLEESCGNER